MYVSRLQLEEFRQYHHLAVDLHPAGIRLVGENASGKSTLVEAVALLATMRSPRSRSDRELLHWRSGRELGFPHTRARSARSSLRMATLRLKSISR